jgi:ABC transporter substrate binding protein
VRRGASDECRVERAEKNMKKKITALVLCAMLFALCLPVEAPQQPTKVARIGYLFTGLQPPKDFLEALGKLGFVEGKNMAFEYRTAEGKEDRLPELARELVRLKVDVIVAPGIGPARAVWEATKTIPIIYMGSGDPVASGLVASLARPGGNVRYNHSWSRVNGQTTGADKGKLSECLPCWLFSQEALTPLRTSELRRHRMRADRWGSNFKSCRLKELMILTKHSQRSSRSRRGQSLSDRAFCSIPTSSG